MDDVQPGKITGRRGHVLEGHFRVAPGTGGISGGGAGLSGGPCRPSELGSGRWSLQNMANTATSAFPTADRARRVCASCKLKFHHDQRCVDTSPGQCYNGGPWDAGRDSGAEDIRYGTDTHQRRMPCEVRR
jgi:hypothetical protein